MVSQTNIILVGIALLVGFVFLRNNNNFSSTSSPSEITIQENPQIQILKDAIKGVQGFINTTFKAPPPRTNLSRAARFQPLPKGSRFAIDPFSGVRIPLPVGPRGNVKTISFFGGQNVLDFNLRKVTQGIKLSTQANQILADLKGQLSILDTKSV